MPARGCGLQHSLVSMRQPPSHLGQTPLSMSQDSPKRHSLPQPAKRALLSVATGDAAVIVCRGTAGSLNPFGLLVLVQKTVGSMVLRLPAPREVSALLLPASRMLLPFCRSASVHSKSTQAAAGPHFGPGSQQGHHCNLPGAPMPLQQTAECCRQHRAIRT